MAFVNQSKPLTPPGDHVRSTTDAMASDSRAKMPYRATVISSKNAAYEAPAFKVDGRDYHSFIIYPVVDGSGTVVGGTPTGVTVIIYGSHTNNDGTFVTLSTTTTSFATGPVEVVLKGFYGYFVVAITAITANAGTVSVDVNTVRTG